MMKKVYICAPNDERIKAYTEYALRCGTAAVVPHFYAACLDYRKPHEKEIGVAAGLSLLWFCDELWVFGKDVTTEMQAEIQFAKNLNIRTVHVNDQEIQKKNKEKSA